MKLFQRIFFAAVLAGLAAGLAMSALQQWKVTPLILEAETYENAATTVEAHSHPEGTAPHTHEEVAPAHTHDEEAWAPQDGAERTFYTVLANVLGGMGFALLLAATSVLLGLPITAANGVIWGLGGFLAFHLAPALGLPPELPGMPAADLGARQLWWWGTALATGAGLLVIAKLRNWTSIGIAAVLLIAPHIIGAPQLAGEHAAAVPAHLATEFAAAALAAGALFWLSVGPLLGWLVERFARREATALKGAHA
ncbi:MAG TPA: CbtA family protein [Devosia sp.]